MLTVRRQQEMGRVLPLAPLDLVDLFLDLERLEVVELWVVRLELRVELVLAALFLQRTISGLLNQPTQIIMMTRLLVALEEDDPAALVAGREVVACRVELDGGDDIGCACAFDVISIVSSVSAPMACRRRTFSDVLDLALVAEALGKAPSPGSRRVAVHHGGRV